MQSYVEISTSTTLASSLTQILSNDKTALSCSSGATFPTANLQVGMLCFRTDINKLYILKDATPTWLLLLDLTTAGGAGVSEAINALLVRNGGGVEGGQINLERPLSGSTIVGNLGIDISSNSFRIFDIGGTNKGFNIDMSLGAASAATKLWHDANDGTGSGLDADLLDGYHAGNATGQVPLSNGTVNTNLNADMIDGVHITAIALLASPAFSGAPTVPTAPVGTNTTQAASTAFVLANAFPTGTRMAFQQTSAPTGWVKDTSAALDDSLMRIVVGTASAGGSTAFSSFNAQSSVGATTLVESQIPSHTHAYTAGATGGAVSAKNGSLGGMAASTSGATGGNGSHSHGFTTAIKYYDFIIAVKS